MMKTLAFVATIFLLFALSECGKKCKKQKGLACDSFENLKPGSSFIVESKKCTRGRYPKNEKCNWYFDVGDCSPSLHCDNIDIKGKGKRCRGDKLTVTTDKKGIDARFCGKKNDVTFTPDETVSTFDVKFTTNRKGQKKGFKCTVSCGEAITTTTKDPATTMLSEECECGLPNRVKRIVGGIETELNEYPWQVGLAFHSADLPFCGGTILSSTTILTAAHCTVYYTISEFDVIVGDHDVTIDDGQERFEVCSKVEHPNYNSNNNDNDLSILTLCSPMTFRTEVKPACLPSLPGPSYDNVLSTVSGWGTLQYGGFQADKLMEVNVTTMTSIECNVDYTGDILPSMICAGDDGKDACQGDSGGPLVTKESDRFYVIIGVVSWGIGCANPEFPGVYSRVTENLDFIRTNLGGTTCKAPVSTGETPVPMTSTGETPVPMTSTSETPVPITSTITTQPSTTGVQSEECECGLPNRVKRIVGGIETEMNEYPWQVGLAYPSSNQPFCGGSILSNKTILTAAHCTVDISVSDFVVIVGDHDVTIDDGQERFKVCSKIEHPDNDYDDSDNDLSVLTLCSPMTFRKEVKPVCLPSKLGPSYENVTATVSGWGTLHSGGFRPNKLMEVNVTTMTNAECNVDYTGDILDSMICAAGDGKDACQGDSGGPLVTKESGKFYVLIGVVSWGIGCANPDFPGVYSRITENLDFIRNNMDGKTCNVPV